MRQELNLVVSPPEAGNEDLLRDVVAQHLNINPSRITSVKVLRRSIDARSRQIKINVKAEVYIDDQPPSSSPLLPSYPDVSNASCVLIAGAGPAGLFAALRLIELGVKPVILERGKDVKSRRRDLAAINKQHIVNPDSNYCFGEGGAGTYSDGKLYTRSTKRGDVMRILQNFVAHGASEEILVEAHPHIGTNKLPKIIVAMRESILKSGGEIHFNTRVTDILVANDRIKGVLTENTATGGQREFASSALILATGHSSRDIFELLNNKSILIEGKQFAMGVRVEHPQSLIDCIQYHCRSIEDVELKRAYLPASSYSLVHQAQGRGVYSFCMCPGGIIAPCATSPGEVVTNGWSPSKRNNPYANSGIVVSVEPEDYRRFASHGPLAGLRYQQELEHMAFTAGGRTQTAPAQRLVDFVNNRLSNDLPGTSYQPGILSAPLHDLLPPAIGLRLQEGFKAFGQKMRGYLTNEAVIHGVESRTSSPVRIPRDNQTLQHPQVEGLYPCGEGAGYAGGIVSAAIDGERCAEACAATIRR
jgi:uncharacterized protein